MFTPVETNSVTTQTVNVPTCSTPQPLDYIDVTNDSFLSPVELFSIISPEPLPGCSKNCSTSDISSRPSSSCSKPCSDSKTQTGLVLSQNTPRKTKLKKRLRYTEIQLKSALKECESLKTINANLQDQLDGPVTLSDFNNICYTLFAGKPTMRKFIKNQARLCTVKAKGRRYTPEEKQFALMVHFYGAKVYGFLKKLWCLPRVRTLQRATENWEIGVGLSDFVFKVL